MAGRAEEEDKVSFWEGEGLALFIQGNSPGHEKGGGACQWSAGKTNLVIRTETKKMTDPRLGARKEKRVEKKSYALVPKRGGGRVILRC